MGRPLKIQTYTNRYYLLALLVFFSFAGILLYFLIQYDLDRELDEELISERAKILNVMSRIDSLDINASLLNDNISYSKISQSRFENTVLCDSTMLDNESNEFIPYRLIKFTAKTKYCNYKIFIRKSEIESSDLVAGIFISLMIVFILSGTLLFVSNYYFSKRLWAPFLETIRIIKSLKLNDISDNLEFKTSNISEFNDLNLSLQQMSQRIKSDYIQLKDFSENASHELQTPLAIIHSKLESLLQSKELNKNDAMLINQALESTVRLSNLNRTLLMLTKIENQQFSNKQKVSFADTFSKYIDLYNELISNKNLKVQFNSDMDFVYEIDPVLSDILVSNLLNNSIRHNNLNGHISISIFENGFEIINSGNAPDSSPESLFIRFKKGNSTSGNIGLGLALVKEIVSANSLYIKYVYSEGLHKISINTKKIF